MIRLDEFKNGVIPSKLYHMTSVDNLDNIFKKGLLCNISKDKKCFAWCDDRVFLFDGLNNINRLMELYEIMLPCGGEATGDITIKNVVLKVDCDKLDRDKFGVDDMVGKNKDGGIISYTYNGNIPPEYISVETSFERTYTLEYLMSD